MKFNIDAFMQTLPIMGLGMVGIFAVTAAIIIVMALLKRFAK